MNEFEAISKYFKHLTPARGDVIIGPGDDAACLELPEGHCLLVSTDTLVADRHFLSSWDAFDIGFKAIMVNVSDIAAMAATPRWLTMSLTLPEINESWLQRFSTGMKKALNACDVSLVGGDLTKGPLTIGVTIHGSAPKDEVVSRKGAQAGDNIYISGQLGGPSFVVKHSLECHDESLLPIKLLSHLKNPTPRIDLIGILQQFASSAIDISDGLSSDLKHICNASEVGAIIEERLLPVDQYVLEQDPKNALDYALNGGDEYEICFTIPPSLEKAFLSELSNLDKKCHKIGVITADKSYQILKKNGQCMPLLVNGYNHFI